MSWNRKLLEMGDRAFISHEFKGKGWEGVPLPTHSFWQAEGDVNLSIGENFLKTKYRLSDCEMTGQIMEIRVPPFVQRHDKEWVMLAAQAAEVIGISLKKPMVGFIAEYGILVVL